VLSKRKLFPREPFGKFGRRGGASGRGVQRFIDPIDHPTVDRLGKSPVDEILHIGHRDGFFGRNRHE